MAWLLAIALVCFSALAGQPDAGTGLKGEYFSDTELRALKLTRTDPKVDFDWSNAPPDKALSQQNFSVRWTGAVKPRCSEEYTFYTVSDDGVALWVNDELLVDNWTLHAATENSGTLRLEAGKRYNLKLEYFQTVSNAIIKLLWSSKSQAKEVIPQSQLYPVLAGPAPGRVKLAAAAPVFSMPPELPALEKREGWRQTLAALDAAGVPQAWLLLGPRPDKDFSVFARARGLEADRSDDWALVPRDDAGKPLAVTLWKRPAEDDGPPGCVDLAQALAREGHALAFARTDVDWPVAGPALLWFACDGRCVVYLNNERVFAEERTWPQPGKVAIPLRMKQGRNVLKLKSGQQAGVWGFYARLERNDSAYRIALLQRLLEMHAEEAAGRHGAEAWLEMARRHEELAQPGEAKAVYQQALSLHGEDDEVRVAVEAALRRIQGDERETAAVAALAWKPAAQKYAGLLQRGDATAADGVLRGFIAQHPFSEQAGAALAVRGVLREDFGLAEESLAYFQRAQRECPFGQLAADACRQGVAFAQNMRAPRRLFETAHELQAALEGARRQLASGKAEDIERAARSLGGALRGAGGALVRVSDSLVYSRHVGAQEYVRAVLASLSPAALAAYRDAVAPTVAERLRLAEQLGNVRALEVVAGHYPYTPAAARALNRAGNLELDRGAYGEAASFFARLLQEQRDHPPPGGAPAAPLLAAKLTQALWHSGDAAAAQETAARLEKDSGKEQVTVGGSSVAAGEFTRRWLASRGHGPPTGAAAPGAREHAFEPGGLVWACALPQSASMETARAAASGGRKMLFAALQPRPVVAEGRAFVSTLESLRALDLASGQSVWSLSWESTGSLVPGRFTGLPVSCPAVLGGRIYTRVLEGGRSALRCCRTTDGGLCWETTGNPALRQRVWLSDPVVACGQAIAVFLERLDVGMNTHGVAALDAVSGEVRWLRPLVMGETGIRVGNEWLGAAMQLAPPAVKEGFVYAPTGLSSLAALNALTGEVVWLSGYPGAQIGDAARGNAGVFENMPARLQKLLARAPASPLVVGDVVVLAPQEAPSVIAFDRRTGGTRWRHELLDARFAAGPCAGHVLMVDNTVRALRAATGATAWEYAVPGGLYGGPAYVDGWLYLPGKSELHVLDARTGALRKSYPWDSRLGPLGNLVLAQDRLIGVNDAAAAAFGPRGSRAVELPLEEARALAGDGKLDEAAQRFARAAADPACALEALTGRVQALQAQNKSQAALADVDRLLQGQPVVLASRNGAWRVSTAVLAEALKARLGQAPAATPAPGAEGLSGTLSYAWHLDAHDPDVTVSPVGPPDCCWVYGGQTLSWLRPGAWPEVLWRTYLGLDNPWVSVGPSAIVVGDKGRFAVVDRATGEPRWSRTLVSLQTRAHADVYLDPFYAAISDERSVAVIARDGLLCFDLVSGKERWWNKQPERRVLHYTFAGGNVAEVSGHGGQPTVFNLYDGQTGKALVTKPLNPSTNWTWSAVSPDGRRVVLKPDGARVWCVDMATGELAWEAKVPDMEFRWEARNLSWEGEGPTYHGENRERPDRAWMVYELNPRDGSLTRAYGAGHAKLGHSILVVGEGGWGALALQRNDLQPPREGVVWGQKAVWRHVLPREQGEGCRLLKAFLSKDGTRLYALYTRESAAFHFVLRSLDWASGQLVDEELLPGTPLPYPDWGKPYRAFADVRGGLLLYTAQDGLYAYTPRADSRRETATKLRAALAEGQDKLPARQHCELRRALAAVEPLTLHAPLAPKETRVDGDLAEWEQAQPLALCGPECYVPLTAGGAWGGADDLSARVYAAWNQAGVFIAVDVRDDRFVPPASAAALTLGDSLCVAVNATPDRRWGYETRATIVCTLGLVDGQPVLSVDDGTASQREQLPAAQEDLQARPAASVKQALDGRGLRYELLLPWPLLRRDPAARPGDWKELRAGLTVFDNDADGVKGALEWGAGLTAADGRACQWQSVFPAWLGRVALLDISHERIERYRKVIARIPGTPEAMQYLRLILSSKRGPRAAQERAAELLAFVKAHPDCRNTCRALIHLRAAYKDCGEADPAARTVAAAREASCPAWMVEWLAGKQDQEETGSGLEGEYYDNQDFTSLKLARVDPVINFDWSLKPPHPAMAADSFSVRWTGQVRPLHSELYTFYTLSDDGVRLWVDDKLLVDNWTDHPVIENSGTIALVAGARSDLKLEYFQGSGVALIGLAWSSASQKKEVIPRMYLFPPASQGGKTPQAAPVDPQKLQAGYREAACLLPDAADGWALLQLALNAYPPEAHAQRIEECEAYLKQFPETVNALPILRTLWQLYGQAGRNGTKECERLMQACRLARDARRAFYAQRVPGWTEWHALGPVLAAGENRGMEQEMAPERGVDLTWKGKGPYDVPLAWQKIARPKEDQSQDGLVDLHRALVEKVDGQKRGMFDREPYFAYACRRVSVPTQRRATLFFGVNDTLAIWLNGKRVVTQDPPATAKDSQAVEVTLREGDNDILLKAGVPYGRLYFFFRIADATGRPFEDLPKD